MSRRHRAIKRANNPDPKYGDIVLSKFMNVLMLDGKKSVAESIVYGALENIESKLKSTTSGSSASDGVTATSENATKNSDGVTDKNTTSDSTDEEAPAPIIYASNSLATFHKALENIAPELEVRSRRVGGATYQVPVEIRSERKQALAIRWLIKAARNRNESTMVERLGAELLDASNNRGGAVKKREDTHKQAESNRAFSHYRW